MLRRGNGGRPNGELGTAVRLLEQRQDQTDRRMEERHDQTQTMVRELRDAVTLLQGEVRTGNSVAALDVSKRADDANHEHQRLDGRIDEVDERLTLHMNNMKWAMALCALTSFTGGVAFEAAKFIWHF